MELLSATDAIGLAFARTRSVLLAPRGKRQFLKLALIAALTQPTFLSVAFTYPLQAAQLAAMGALHRHGASHFGAGGAILAGSIALLVIGFAFAVASGVGVTYVLCRLRFVLFDLVLYREGVVRQGWRKYRREAWRYFGIMMLGVLAFLLLAAVFGGPAFLHLSRTAIVSAHQGQNSDPFAVLGAMLPLFVVIFAISLLYSIFDAIVEDFMLPPMALEDAPIEGAFVRVRGLFAESPGQTLLYLLLRFVLGIGLSAVMMMVVFVAMGLLAACSAALGVLLFHPLWGHGPGPQAIFIAIVGVLTLMLLAAWFLAATSAFGILGVFRQSYALCFYGPRYPQLGNRLDPPEDSVVADPVMPMLPQLPDPPPVW